MKNVVYAPYILIVLLLSFVGIVMWKSFFATQVSEKTFEQSSRENIVRPRGNEQRSNYKYSSAVAQPVTFYAQYSKDSDKMIARKGIIFKKPGARATVVICHGFMCDKTDVRFMRMLFHEYNVMLFDFRAHGECRAGQECTFGYDEVYDVLAAGNFIKSDPELGKLPLIVYGFSMGAVSAIHAQSKNERLFDCAILDCPFDSTDALLDRSIENLTMSCFGYTVGIPGRDLLKKYAYNPYVQKLVKYLLNAGADMEGVMINTNMVPIDVVTLMEKVSIPVFFITCRNDKRAPPSAVRKLYDNARGHCEYWITNGNGHFRSFFCNPELYTDNVQQFIVRFLDGEFANSINKKLYQDEPEIGVG